MLFPHLEKSTTLTSSYELMTEIIPFDLKITHVSDDYFELASRGISVANNTA